MMIENKTNSAIESFDQTFEKNNLIDTFSQVGEVAIDTVINNELLKDIPILGLLFSGYKTIVNIRDYRLMQKVIKFFYNLQNTTPKQRQNFSKKYLDVNKEKTAAALLDILEKLNNVNSVDLITNLMKAVISEDISITQFNRLVIAIQRTAYTDMVQLEKYINEYDEVGLSDALLSTGLLYQSTYSSNDAEMSEDCNKFKISTNGYLLLKYGFNKKNIIESPRITDISASIKWTEI